MTPAGRLPPVMLITAAAMSACAVGPNFRAPPPPGVDRYLSGSLPTQTASSHVGSNPPQRLVDGGAADAQWWRLFESPSLDLLETEALRQNADLAAARAALRQAHEALLAQRASMAPNLQIAASGSRVKNPDVLASPLSSNAQSYSLYSGQFNIAYVLDVFGGQRRQVEVLGAQADFQRFQTQAAYLAVTTNVASTALQIASLNSQLAATEASIASYRQMLEITQHMQALGESSAADVASAEGALEQAAQAEPGLRKQLAQSEDLMAVYLGRPVALTGTHGFQLSDFRLPRDLPVVLPSTLIRRRPDVRAAEANLHAASAQVGVALAARLPSFELNGALGGTSTTPWTLLSPENALWSFSGSVSQTLFDAGALRHRQKAAQSALEQAQAQYRGAVLTALQNTADVLQAIVRDAESLDHADRAAAAAAASLNIAQTQYEHGQTSALTVLSAEAAARQAQVTLLQARSVRYADTVALFQALGGGWSADASEEAGR